MLSPGKGGKCDESGGAYPCADTESEGIIVEAVVDPGWESV